MGSIIDSEYSDDIFKCSDVKFTVIIINLVGAPLSFILLVVCMIRIIISSKKRELTFLAKLILIIFSSEILNTISKMLQLCKYIFEKTKITDKNNNTETSRGIICQIQIIFSIISDFCSLLGTLLISIRCYDVIRNRKKYFDKKKYQVFSILIIIFSSIILSIIFLIFDKILI